MKNKILRISFTLVLFISEIIAQSGQNIAEIGDFKLLSGDIIKNCKIGYRTFGYINNDSTNIIIYPTWFEGTSEGIAALIQKYAFVDSSKYFIIAIDAIGNGVSSSPSNYEYSDSAFNNLTIRDLVNSQYKFLTERFGINHIYAAVGGSMGSMQVLEWAVAYPDFMDKIVAYVATPKMSSYDLLWMSTQLNVIESCRRNGMPDKEIKKISEMITSIIARTPEYTVEHTKIEEFSEYLASFDKAPNKEYSLDNSIVLLNAMMKHDISLGYNGLMYKAAESIKADLFMIVSKTDMMVNPTEALNLAELTGAKTLILNNNCGHLAVSCEIYKCRDAIAKFLNE